MLVWADLTARYTLYSTMSPVLVLGGSQLRWAPSVDLEILMALGAPGKPEGRVSLSSRYFLTISLYLVNKF